MKAGLGGDEESQGSGGHKQHECFEIPVHPPFCITGGRRFYLDLGVFRVCRGACRLRKSRQPVVLAKVLDCGFVCMPLAGLNIGLAFAGEGSFIWSFRNHK